MNVVFFYIGEKEIRRMKVSNFDISKYKCAIFDVDGTILNSMPMWQSITFEYADAKGVKVPEGMEVEMNSMSLYQCAVYYKDLGVDETVEEIMDGIIAMAADRYRYTVQPMPGAVEFLKYIKGLGLRICLATASDISAIRPGFERLGIMDLVDYHITCSDIGKSKEHPDIYIACAEHFGLGIEDSVVFEDMFFAADTAKKAGFTVVGMNDPIQDTQARENIRGVCDYFISDFAEIMPPAGRNT